MSEGQQNRCICTGTVSYTHLIGPLTVYGYGFMIALGVIAAWIVTDYRAKLSLIHILAYLLEGMKRLPAIRSYPMRVTYDDTTIVDDFIFGMITNSVSVGGFKRITGKNVKLDDGVFEVTLIKRPKNPIELNNIMVSLLNRDIDTDAMYCFRTSKLEITSTDPLPWTLDGEYGGTHTKVVIENICKGMDIRVE